VQEAFGGNVCFHKTLSVKESLFSLHLQKSSTDSLKRWLGNGGINVEISGVKFTKLGCMSTYGTTQEPQKRFSHESVTKNRKVV
jgi:hypothetical protein